MGWAFLVIGSLVGSVAAGLGEMEMGMALNLMPRASATATTSGANLQTFTGELGGAKADPVSLLRIIPPRMWAAIMRTDSWE